MGIKVVRSDNGMAPGWAKAIGRTLFAQWISASIFYLGDLWLLWDADKQTWHDKVAGTYVVRGLMSSRRSVRSEDEHGADLTTWAA